MWVDRTAAMQGVENARSKHHIDRKLADSIYEVTRRISKPGSVGRSIFRLADFFVELAKVDFGDQDWQVSYLLEELGRSLAEGVGVASYENKEQKEKES